MEDLKLKSKTYDANIHGGCSGLRNNSSHRFGRSFVFLCCRNTSCVNWFSRSWICNLGRTFHFTQVQSALKSKLITIATLFGLLFVIPVNAMIIEEQTDATVSQTNSGISTKAFVQSLGNHFNGITFGSIKTYLKYNQANKHLDIFSCDNSDYGTTLTCTNIVHHESIEHIDSSNTKLLQTFTFTPWTANNQYYYLAPPGTGTLYAHTVYGSNSGDDKYLLGDCYYDSTYCANIEDLNFTIYDTEGTPIGEEDFTVSSTPATTGNELPTSTYNGNYSEQLPEVGWEESVSVSTTYFLQGKIDRFAGSTTSTFPMCIVYPWFSFLDLTIANISSSTGDSLTISGGMIPTSTINLNSAPQVIADTGLKNILDPIIALIEAMAWLSLGIWIFRDLFSKGEINESTL